MTEQEIRKIQIEIIEEVINEGSALQNKYGPGDDEYAEALFKKLKELQNDR